MNRATRRKLANTPHLLERTVQTYTEEQQRKAIAFAIKSMAAVMAISLHDKYGWGKKRINELISYASNQYACCRKGEVDIEEIISWAKEYGIEI